jgi:hypothetical protein
MSPLQEHAASGVEQVRVGAQEYLGDLFDNVSVSRLYFLEEVTDSLERPMRSSRSLRSLCPRKNKARRSRPETPTACPQTSRAPIAILAMMTTYHFAIVLHYASHVRFSLVLSSSLKTVHASVSRLSTHRKGHTRSPAQSHGPPNR